MRHKVLFSVLLAMFLCAAPALAEQIIHFTNGTSMPIRSHEIRAQMIHVDLGGDAFIAFPVSMIEKVVDAGKEVVLDPSGPGANQIMEVDGGPEGSFPLRGQAPPRHRQSPRGKDRSQAAPNEVDRNTGLAAVPVVPGAAPNKRDLRTTGNTSRRQPGSFRGTTRVGNRQAIGPLPGRRRAVQLSRVQVGPSGSGNSQPKEQDPAGSGSDDSGSEN